MEHLLCEPTIGGEGNVCGMEIKTKCKSYSKMLKILFTLKIQVLQIL